MSEFEIGLTPAAAERAREVFVEIPADGSGRVDLGKDFPGLFASPDFERDDGVLLGKIKAKDGTEIGVFQEK